jgi:type VI secretion system secreted protein Hcp
MNVARNLNHAPNFLVDPHDDMDLGYSKVLSLKGIDGDCQVEGYAGHMSVLKVSFAATSHLRNGTGKHGSLPDSAVSPIYIEKLADKSTPVLLKNLLGPTRIPEGQIFLLRKGTEGKTESYLTITLTNVGITDYTLVTEEGRSLETFRLTYDTVEIVYNHEATTGTFQGKVGVKYDANKQTQA